MGVVLVGVECLSLNWRSKEEDDHPVDYAFKYEVNDKKTGDVKSHEENRKGDHTSGAYSMIEADGSKRLVEYTVEGASGFQAVVRREPAGHLEQGGSPSLSLHSISYHLKKISQRQHSYQQANRYNLGY